MKLGTKAPWLGRPQDNHLSSIIPASRTIDSSIRDAELFGTTILCVPLNLKHGSGASVQFYGSSRGNKQAAVGTGNVPRRVQLQQLANYDRMIEFGDLSDPGRCFTVFLRDQSASRTMLKYFADIPALGTPCMIGSPDKAAGKTKASDMPIVEGEFPYVPLCNETHASFDLTLALPEVPMVIPDQPGELKYFILHGQPVTMNRTKYIKTGVSCTGRTCDRSMIPSTSKHCGCLHQGFDQCASVLQCTLVFDVPADVAAYCVGEVSRFRSQRFTELVVSDNKNMQKTSEDDLNEHYLQLHSAMQALGGCVNDHGGWTIVGWMRRGEIHDKSTLGGTAESLETKLHVVRLSPTSAEIRNLRDDAFNDLRLKIE